MLTVTKNYLKYFILFIIPTILFSCEKENKIHDKDIPPSIPLDRRYDQVCFLMTHNSMNSAEKSFLIPNQTLSVTNQLKYGARGLMLDTYDGDNNIALTYHGIALLGSEKLYDVLMEIKSFLLDNPKEIVTIIFENNGSNAQLEKAIDSSKLNLMTYTHAGGNWPTLQTLVDNNQRLVLFVENDKTPRASYLMHAWSTIFDTKYTFKSVNEFDSDINRGGSGTKELYLVNHWLSNGLGLPDKTLAPQANNRATISKRVQDCFVANSHFINYLGVDFVEIGDAKAVVDSINGL